MRLILGAVAVLVIGIVSCDAQAHERNVQCGALIEKLPEGAELVDMQEDRWSQRVFISHGYCLIKWDTFNSGYPPTFTRRFNCTYEPSLVYKYNKKLPGRNLNTGPWYEYFWNCPK